MAFGVCVGGGSIFRGMSTGKFNHAPVSLWATQIELGILGRLGGACKSERMDLVKMGSKSGHGTLYEIAK